MKWLVTWDLVALGRFQVSLIWSGACLTVLLSCPSLNVKLSQLIFSFRFRTPPAFGLCISESWTRKFSLIFSTTKRNGGTSATKCTHMKSGEFLGQNISVDYVQKFKTKYLCKFICSETESQLYPSLPSLHYYVIWQFCHRTQNSPGARSRINVAKNDVMLNVAHTFVLVCT